MAGRLTTHVLDTTHGRPAGGIEVELYRVVRDQRMLVVRTRTNADGRCDAPLLEGAAFQPGTYELVFRIGDYFAAMGALLVEPRYLDVVPIRFGVADPEAHYHVPLLVSPYGYATYRGS